jgi:hypothetical protein
MLSHGCGWSGNEADLEKEYVDGFLVAIVCPKCRAASPWGIYEDAPDDPDTPEEPVYVPRNRDNNKGAGNKRLRMWS